MIPNHSGTAKYILEFPPDTIQVRCVRLLGMPGTMDDQYVRQVLFYRHWDVTFSLDWMQFEILTKCGNTKTYLKIEDARKLYREVKSGWKCKESVGQSKIL